MISFTASRREMNMTIYRGHVDGFFGTFTNLDELRAWAISRRDKWGCKGKTLTITQGVKVGSAEYYAAHCPRKEVVL